MKKIFALIAPLFLSVALFAHPEEPTAPVNADVQKGDQLVTSGIDGVYPAGLPVAEVIAVEHDPAQMFAKVACRPLGNVGSHTRVFVVHAAAESPPRPVEEAEKSRRGRRAAKGNK